jgi:hypothetical protein
VELAEAPPLGSSSPVEDDENEPLGPLE